MLCFILGHEFIVLLIFQICGAPSLVRKALYEISARLHQHPRKENLPLEEIIDASTQRKHGSPQPLPHGNPMLPHLHIDHPPPIPLLDPYRDGPLRTVETEEFSIRVLCASELIGSIIGKSGANVKRVEQQTGARIKVQEVDKDASGERLIIISSKELPADPVSPTIEALMLIHDKAARQMHGREDHRGLTSVAGYSSTIELRIPNSSLESIIGIGGVNLAEIRQISGAKLRLLEAHTGSSESVVEIQGTLDQAKTAQSLVQGFISANSRSTQQQPQSSRMPLYPSWG
nr:unnamed protein product [Digitaria exilis]